MDGFIILLIDRFGWGALVGGVLLYLVVEGALDISTDLISHSIIKRREKKANEEWDV